MGAARTTGSALVALAVLAPLPAAAAAVGPEPGHTGGFGEPTCRACHFDNPLDAAGGALRLEGVPSRPVAGESYRLRVVLERPGLRRGGFQLAARFAAGAGRGRSAGLLRPVDGRVEVTAVESRGVEYAHHSAKGTEAASPGELRWELDWIAPQARLPVAFHAAANATNDDDSELGDFVYAADAACGGTIPAAAVSPASTPPAARIAVRAGGER